MDDIRHAAGMCRTAPIVDIVPVIEPLAEHGADVAGSTPEQLGALVKSERIKWQGVVQRAKLTAD